MATELEAIALRRSRARACRSTGLVVLVLSLLVAASPAAASGRKNSMLLTIAARTCPSYTAIAANRARNNIMESLRDLGPDTTYSAGQPIDPQTEQSTQPLCTPLPNWRFTLGTGYITRAVTGPWGALSIVTNPFSTNIVTQAQTPLLDTHGHPTGKMLAGATTITLTPQQADLAARGNSLWIQGGTPADPILNQPYPGQYGFGALRCAIDNLNGDNVEWIGYPSDITHVFCYAYYVKPPPTSGTVIVRKVVDAPAGTSNTFSFDGNISYNTPNGDFDLAVVNNQPAQQTFYRGATGSGDPPWTVNELPSPNWELESLSCVSQSGGSTTAISGASASITLAGGDTVTCTYTDRFALPKGTLTVSKVTHGGVGTFDFDVTPGDTHLTATTTQPEIAVNADQGPLTLAPGSYTVTETLPSSSAGHWSVDGADCNGQTTTGSASATVDLPTGGSALCTFSNTFTPDGAIAISKVTHNGTGTAGFVISPLAPPAVQYFQSATTTAAGVAAKATGDSTATLPLGSYAIDETAPAGSELTSIVCNGALVPFSQGRAIVELTPAQPKAHCVYTNTLDVPVPPVPPVTPGTVTPTPAADPSANLSVTKTASATTVAPGQTITYNIAVTNHGTGNAYEVVLGDELPATLDLVDVKSERGRCTTARPIVCQLGTIEPHQTVTATVTVTVAATAPAGAIRNVAAVGTASSDAVLSNNVEGATVDVKAAAVTKKPTPRPHFTG